MLELRTSILGITIFCKRLGVKQNFLNKEMTKPEAWLVLQVLYPG